MTIIEKAKKNFYQKVKDHKSDPYHLLNHLKEMEKWAKFMINKNNDVDEEVILLSVFLHDIGHYPIDLETDHAVKGEKIAKKWLELELYDSEKTKNVLHCVRSHRCKDIMPETKEAKIIAFIDSISHMTDFVYLDIAKCDKETGSPCRSFAKMERDLRDLGLFPEIQKNMLGIYNAWKNLITEYNKLEIDF